MLQRKLLGHNDRAMIEIDRYQKIRFAAVVKVLSIEGILPRVFSFDF